MTEADWLTSHHPAPMLDCLKGKASERKLRLFVVAGGYLGWGEPATIPLTHLDVVVEYADGRSSVDEIRRYWLHGNANEPAWPERPFEWASDFVSSCPEEGQWGEAQEGYPGAAELPPFLRDIFGNPFRPVIVDPAWQTADVVALAQAIYEERAFDRMPILGDALEDAGCTNADVLTHCRQRGEHVRGCWVVDLLLGKK